MIVEISFLWFYIILKKEVEENGYSATGRKYGVSDKSIKKWIIQYEK